MDVGIQLLIGAVCGFVLGFFTIVGAINQKEKELKGAWLTLVESLNIRYLKLKNVLNFLSRHMNEFQDKIQEVIRLCDEAAESDPSITNIAGRLSIENEINYKLSEIKSNMDNYPSLSSDPDVDGAILAIAESEAYVGEAISIYNGKNLEYKVFLETFPIVLVAWILNKNADILPFEVTQSIEFDDSYIDEDEI